MGQLAFADDLKLVSRLFGNCPVFGAKEQLKSFGIGRKLKITKGGNF
jgi:hypothetical protein